MKNIRTPHDAILQTKYKRLMEFIEKYDLLDLWEDTVADYDDLTITQLINLAEALINKNNLRFKG